MSKLRNLLGLKMWIGVFFAFMICLAANAFCSVLLVKGVMPDMSINACVYASWGVGSLLGTCIGVKGEDGTLLRGLLLGVVCFGLAWLLGFAIYGTVNFGGYDIGVALAIILGCILGGVLGGGKKRKKRHMVGKRVNGNRHKK